MGHIPGGREVERSLKESLREVKSALKQINAQAAKMLSKGDYTKVEGLISVAKKVGEFEMELEGVRNRWKEIERASNQPNQSGEKPLPLWKYYRPTLQVLRDLGGTARKETIEHEMESKGPELLPASEMNSKGKRPRWTFMMHRALAAMEKEGFVERFKKDWRITPSGRKAADSAPKEKES